MFIKSLIIFRETKIIRKINFRLGVNLIVDETSTTERKTTGNNVGKTTFLRLIDYCLGAKKEIIYKNKDLEKEVNNEVKAFLSDPSTIVKLILTKKWSNSDSENVVIRRNFVTDKNKIQEINYEPIMHINKFTERLKKIIYEKQVGKPSFRQVVSKNVRVTNERIADVVRVLDKNSKKVDWDGVFLFWLGIEFQGMAEKIKISKELERDCTYGKRLKKDYSSEQINQILEMTEKEIKEHESKKNRLLNSEDYQKHTKKLDEIRKTINEVNTELMGLKYRENLIKESKKELKKQKTNVDSEKVKYLYDKAKKLIPQLQKSFEETLKFYNQMIKNRIQYIGKELPKIEKDILNLEETRENLREKENIKTKTIERLGFKDNLETIITELNQNYETQGKFKENKNMIQKIEQKIFKEEKEIEEIDKKNLNVKSLFKERIKILNEYFREFSKQLYQQGSSLTYDTSNESNKTQHFDLNVVNMGQNLGKGKILGLIGAFEMAYIRFADKLRISIPKFVLQDQLESIDENQLDTLFTKIIPSVDCQYITALLKDKLSQEQINKYQILKLSQNNKLFNI